MAEEKFPARTPQGPISTSAPDKNASKVCHPVSSQTANGVGARRGVKIFGVEFAPLNTPLERRYQTLAAMMWFVTLVFGGVIGWSLVAFLVFRTPLWHVTLLYLLWMIYDRHTCELGGRWIEYARDLAWWKHFRNYFPVSLERTVPLPPDRNYLFCSYPHGVLCAGAFAVFATAEPKLPVLFPGIRTNLITLSQHFQSPFVRELGYGLGGVSSSARAIRSVLRTPGGGRAAVLVVGGAAESLLSRPGKYHILLKCRKGFCRIALEEGSPLVPVFSFGEPDLYDQVDNPRGSLMYKIQEGLRKMIGIAPVIPIGRGLFQYSFGLIPRRRPVTVVVGKPIDVVKTAAPTKTEVDELHAKFTKALIELFETNKERFHPGQNVKLIID